jgi:gamma-glutamylcyclotransferase (GGCT)/AIG2-like uncharacterized protein YtfP
VTERRHEIDVFVYGTLVPGGRYYDVVDRFVGAHRPATVRGHLYDTGQGYPAATFADDAPELRGVVLTLTDAEAALAHLDRFEGDEYRRVRVTTSDGRVAVAYEWRGQTATLRPISRGAWGSL